MRCVNISSKQIKAARALLNWSQDVLASSTNLSVSTIRKVEMGNTTPHLATRNSIRKAIERAGVEFLAAEGVRRVDNVIQFGE